MIVYSPPLVLVRVLRCHFGSRANDRLACILGDGGTTINIGVAIVFFCGPFRLCELVGDSDPMILSGYS